MMKKILLFISLIPSYSFASVYTPNNVVDSVATGSIVRSNELILKKNSRYMFFIESDAASNIISYCA